MPLTSIGFPFVARTILDNEPISDQEPIVHGLPISLATPDVADQIGVNVRPATEAFASPTPPYRAHFPKQRNVPCIARITGNCESPRCCNRDTQDGEKPSARPRRVAGASRG